MLIVALTKETIVDWSAWWLFAIIVLLLLVC
jgi:hypothetical protein